MRNKVSLLQSPLISTGKLLHPKPLAMITKNLEDQSIQADTFSAKGLHAFIKQEKNWQSDIISWDESHSGNRAARLDFLASAVLFSLRPYILM